MVPFRAGALLAPHPDGDRELQRSSLEYYKTLLNQKCLVGLAVSRSNTWSALKSLGTVLTQSSHSQLKNTTMTETTTLQSGTVTMLETSP